MYLRTLFCYVRTAILLFETTQLRVFFYKQLSVRLKSLKRIFENNISTCSSFQWMYIYIYMGILHSGQIRGETIYVHMYQNARLKNYWTDSWTRDDEQKSLNCRLDLRLKEIGQWYIIYLTRIGIHLVKENLWETVKLKWNQTSCLWNLKLRIIIFSLHIYSSLFIVIKFNQSN